MRFEIERHFFFTCIFVLAPCLVSIVLFISTFYNYAALNHQLKIILMVVNLIVIWVAYKSYRSYTTAHYSIDTEYLQYKLGWHKGSIPINDIHGIKEMSYPSAGVRPAFSFKGLNVHYGAGYNVFLSPKNRPSFLYALLEINSEIKIA